MGEMRNICKWVRLGYIDGDEEVGGGGGVPLDMTCVVCACRRVVWADNLICFLCHGCAYMN